MVGALQVVLASQGYPGSYQKGSAIRGLEDVSTAKVSTLDCSTLQCPLQCIVSAKLAGWMVSVYD